MNNGNSNAVDVQEEISWAQAVRDAQTQHFINKETERQKAIVDEAEAIKNKALETALKTGMGSMMLEGKPRDPVCELLEKQGFVIRKHAYYLSSEYQIFWDIKETRANSGGPEGGIEEGVKEERGENVVGEKEKEEKEEEDEE